MVLFTQHMLGDTEMKLKRVQQLRKLLEAEGDFPITGAGMRLEQVGSWLAPGQAYSSL
jgi:hypothetical protein